MRFRRTLKTVALATALAVPLLGAVPADAAAKDLVTVKGHVRAPDGHGIAGLHVLVRTNPHDNADTADARTRTSASGRYEVRVERGRTFRLRVTDPGDADRDAADGVWATAGTAVTTSASVVRIDQVVQPGAVLRGTVRDAAGRPVKAGLVVFALTRTPATGYRSVGDTVTRADGTYRFTNLPAGTAVLGFDSPTRKGASRFFTGSAGGSLSASDGAAIDLVAGATHPRVDFRFPLVASIRGTVTLDGRPFPWRGSTAAEVVLRGADGAQLMREPVTDAFALLDLAPGTYFLEFRGSGLYPERIRGEWYRDAADLAHATPVVVRRGQDLSGLKAALARR